MKIKKLWVLGIASLLVAAQSNSQTVDELVKKYVDAMGGADKLGKVTSIYEEQTISAMGNESPATVTILNGKGYKSEMDFGGQKIVQVYTDKSGWSINPFGGSTDAAAMPEDQYKAGKDQIDVGGSLFNYQAKGNKVELAGRENVGTVSAYKLKVTTAANVESTIYLDPTTYYIIKLVRNVNVNGQSMDISISYSNYQKTDYGIPVASNFEANYGDQFSMTSTIKKVEVNKAVDPKIFDMPK
ncbi:MAG: outer membrane lipoprotein-sorting protein [Bacteroidetes bacterium]|nr:MAG: outer membrane lipoprotein-sorting protein [Bacteroidota bacterium]